MMHRSIRCQCIQQVHSLVPAADALAQAKWSKNRVTSRRSLGFREVAFPVGAAWEPHGPHCAYGQKGGARVSLSDKTEPENSL